MNSLPSRRQDQSHVPEEDLQAPYDDFVHKLVTGKTQEEIDAIYRMRSDGRLTELFPHVRHLIALRSLASTQAKTSNKKRINHR